MFVSPTGLSIRLTTIRSLSTSPIITGTSLRLSWAKSKYALRRYQSLGLPGWTYLPGEDMIANLGMHDSLAAVEWTFRFISRFGGDPNRVTVMGQSAAGGIINLLTVLNGGEGTLPFQQVEFIVPLVAKLHRS